MAKVKICGIKNAEDALTSTKIGADELGFHVVLDGGRSPLTPEEAAAMIGKLPAHVSAVVVTSATEPEKLIAIAKATGAKVLQLYGDASVETIRATKEAAPNVAVWKVLNVFDERSVAKAKEYESVADAIALDSIKGERKGGTGQTHDWSVSKRIVEAVKIPVVLAGGLTPENVTEAVRIVKPQVVDVNSGVSNADGSKNIEKVKAFVAAAKSA
jgi:phosphoribosylanthranilate isomerase